LPAQRFLLLTPSSKMWLSDTQSRIHLVIVRSVEMILTNILTIPVYRDRRWADSVWHILHATWNHDVV
jgi:hypothetical protein